MPPRHPWLGVREKDPGAPKLHAVQGKKKKKKQETKKKLNQIEIEIEIENENLRVIAATTKQKEKKSRACPCRVSLLLLLLLSGVRGEQPSKKLLLSSDTFLWVVPFLALGKSRLRFLFSILCSLFRFPFLCLIRFDLCYLRHFATREGLTALLSWPSSFVLRQATFNF